MISAVLIKARLMGYTLLASYTIFCSTLVAAPADQQETTSCQIIRGDGTSYLERCGNRFRYVGLSLDDLRGRLEPIGRHGQFYFRCLIKPMCANQPAISGWFIDRAWWARSGRGEDAVFAAVRLMPINALSWGMPGRPANPPKSQCGLLDFQVAGVPARGVCHLYATGSQIIIVGGDDDFAFVLIFTQEGLEFSALLEKAREMLPKFQIEKLWDEAVLRKQFQ
jgi:hypothetical protein